LTLHFKRNYYVPTIIGSLIVGFFVYTILSYFYVAAKISIPLSITLPLLIFGLTNYYSKSRSNNNDGDFAIKGEVHSKDHNKKKGDLLRILFVILFGIVVLISAFASKNSEIFVNWNEIGVIGIIQLGAAIVLSFFMPGLAIMIIIMKKYKMDTMLAVLLAYLLSMLITGLTAFISALSFGSAISDSKVLFIALYLGIIVAFILCNLSGFIKNVHPRIKYSLYHDFMKTIVLSFLKKLKLEASALLVFATLFTLLILSTYYIYGGLTIGDQWFHQGRAILFMSGSFREAVLSGAESSYPPFQSALIAALTTLSGIPLVNSYASIAFFSMMPLFAFYYFFLSWVPTPVKKSGLIAISLFAIGSGFGWIYLLGNNIATHSITSPHSMLEVIWNIRPVDFITAANFFISTGPDFNTGLIYIALPAGFVLLGMVQCVTRNQFINTAIVAGVSILGIISHDEFYIFIIVASLLPPIFKMKQKNYLYLGLALAFLIVFTLDTTNPGKFFTTNILRIPLFYLNVLFVAICWAIYSKGDYLFKFLGSRTSLLKLSTGKFPIRNIRFNYKTRVLFISVVAYLYLLSFIVLGQLPIDIVKIQSSDSSVPWYLYPTRLGIAGLFGFAFIVSLFFRRIEKQIFVFGILIIISLITGPFYNENRFSKYVMFGMIGFASIMIYEILLRVSANRLHTLIIIGGITVFSSLSVLLFIGYSSNIMLTHDFDNALSRRHFPSQSQMQLFKVLREQPNFDSGKYNIISIPTEYDPFKDSIMPKIQAFTGLPSNKLIESILILNTSTLDSFYHLLDITGTKYIIIPKNSIAEKSLTDPTLFALDNFKRIYEDSDYIILEVPYLRGPSQKSGELAIVYGDDPSLIPTAYRRTYLQFNDTTFNTHNDSTSFMEMPKNNQGKIATVYGYKKADGVTLWSKNLNTNDSTSLIRATFKILNVTNTGKDSAGLKWLEGNKTNFISLSDGGLELTQQASPEDNKSILLYQNGEVAKNVGRWYSLKVAFLDNSTNIYVDDELKMKVPRTGSEKKIDAISKVGISSVNNTAQFEPIQIGKIQSSEKYYERRNNFDYYYPISILALSNGSYASFSADDYSVTSKNKILLPYDRRNMSDAQYDEYLNFARRGGKLIVMNFIDNFEGKFSKLFSIIPVSNKKEEFTQISGQNNLSALKVAGFVKSADVKPSSDIKVIATYRNENNKAIAPFAIEKRFTNSGKIILINDNGYFNAIYANPRKYFPSLANVSNMLGLNLTKTPVPQNISSGLKAFIGNMEISGQTVLKAPSFSLVNSSGINYNLAAKNISIYSKQQDLEYNFKNISILDLKTYGKYEVLINSTGTLKLPPRSLQYDYFGVSIPNDFNMTINLLDKNSHAEIVSKNDSLVKTIEVKPESKIVFTKIKTRSSSMAVPVLVKSPEIKVYGNSSFKKAIYNFFRFEGTINGGSPLDIDGQLEAKLDSVDNYDRPIGNGTGTRTDYITYLQSITMNGKINEYRESPFKLPGDISYEAKQKGILVPLEDILLSYYNIILLITIATATVIVCVLIGHRRKLMP
jgi:hypothetical protein